MKIILSLALAISLASTYSISASAEDSGEQVSQWVEQLLERKRQAIASTVHFEQDEAEKFWPLYDTYAAEIGPVIQRLAAVLDRYRIESETLSEQDANRIIDDLLTTNTKSTSIQREYVTQVREVLPAKKVLQVSYIVLTSTP